MDKKNVREVVKRLSLLYPQADTELEFASPYQLLVAVILSAQCTDRRVNAVTKELFREYGTPQAMVTLSQEELEQKIFSCGFYHNKAAHVLATSQALLDRFEGEVPADLEALRSLPGVGRKTANVVAAVGFGIPAIAVDTHVFRVSNRIGLAESKDVLHTELQLQKAVPKEQWLFLHHLLIWHGRRCCSSQKPKCADCPLTELCAFYRKEKK